MKCVLSDQQRSQNDEENVEKDSKIGETGENGCSILHFDIRIVIDSLALQLVSRAERLEILAGAAALRDASGRKPGTASGRSVKPETASGRSVQPRLPRTTPRLAAQKARPPLLRSLPVIRDLHISPVLRGGGHLRVRMAQAYGPRRIFCYSALGPPLPDSRIPG